MVGRGSYDRENDMRLILVVASCLGMCAFAAGEPANWSQFRGPAFAHAIGIGTLPVDIGPQRHVLWKVAVPAGHSSPVIHGDRIFLTGVRDKVLLTMC